MSYDFSVWKWKPDADQVDLAEVFRAFDEDNAHPALTRFDRAAFERALAEAFGDVHDVDSPIWCEMADFAGVPANWAGVSCSFREVGNLVPKLMEVCSALGLVLYDWQESRILVGELQS